MSSVSIFESFSKFFKLFWSKSNLKEKNYIIISLAFLFLSKIGMITLPLIFRECIDYLNDPQPHDLFYPFILIMIYVGVNTASVTFSEIREYLFIIVSQNFLEKISSKSFDHIQKLSITFHEEKKRGSLARILDRGKNSIEQILNIFIYEILPSFCEILFILCIISINSYKYLIIFVFGIVLYSIYTIILMKHRNNKLRILNDCMDIMSDQTMDSLINVDSVKIFANEKKELEKYNKATLDYKNRAIECQKSLFFLNTGQEIILSLTLGSVLILSLLNFFNGDITLGTFMMLNTYLFQIFIPIKNLSHIYKTILDSIISMEKMLEILKIPNEFKDKNFQNNKLLKLPLTIEFRKVNFTYHKKEKLFYNFDLLINSGEKIALIGQSGHGKSTIAKLLQQFYNIQSGCILLNGINAYDIDKQELRKNINYIPQDISLFNDTIYNNILYGNLFSSNSEVINAAEMANIHSFIMSLPQNYQTLVGERGLKLSGGERQRIAIARAFLKNASLIILDEATSQLDIKNEREILNNIQRKFIKQTMIIITHRLSNIKNIDKIHVLHKGKIVCSGNHESLLNISSTYKNLWYKELYN